MESGRIHLARRPGEGIDESLHPVRQRNVFQLESNPISVDCTLLELHAGTGIQSVQQLTTSGIILEGRNLFQARKGRVTPSVSET